MKNSFSNTMKLRASSAQPRKIETPVNMQKREKLKQLLTEKILKKFNLTSNSKLKIYVEKEVALFTQKEKLTEEGLKELEERIRINLNDKNLTEEIKNRYSQQSNAEEIKASEIFNENYLPQQNSKQIETDDNNSIHSINSQFSKQSSIFDVIKYEKINDFNLRKLLQNQKKPTLVQKINSENEDDWAAITKYKAQKLEESEKQNKILERKKKIEQREIYNSQIKEKENQKQQSQVDEVKNHRILVDNLNKLNYAEKKRVEEELEKKRLEKEIREKQIQEKVEKKLNDFSSSRNFDKQLIENIQIKNEIEKKKEREKQSEAKKNLQRMLKDNEEFKRKQSESQKKEKEEDIKAMEEYSKILEKQEQDRIAYFKKCETRQLAAINRMAENVVKKENEKVKVLEENVKIYQIEKDKKDQEEEEKKKKNIKDSKVMMREYLLNQMTEKKEMNKIEKITDSEQVDMWNKENKDYFDRTKEINERMKTNTKHYAEFLKSQMIDRKRKVEKMNEEELRINKEIIDEMVSKTPGTFKRNFLI